MEKNGLDLWSNHICIFVTYQVAAETTRGEITDIDCVVEDDVFIEICIWHDTQGASQYKDVVLPVSGFLC